MTADWKAYLNNIDPYERRHSRDIGLGDSLRIRLVQAAAHTEVSGHKAMSNSAFAAQFPGLAVQDALNSSKQYPVPRPVFTAVMRWFAATKELDSRILVDGEFRGATAVDDFHGYLLDLGLAPSDNTTLLGETVFHGSRVRDAMVGEVIEFLQVEDPGLVATPNKIIQVVSGLGMPEGLRAFANHLVAESDARKVRGNRPVCFLPVARDPKSNDFIASDQLIGRLWAFFHRQPELDKWIPKSLGERRNAIEAIRLAMARYPAILVFDGWASASGPMSRLDAVVEDDGLVDLLSQLEQPHLGPDAATVDVTRFWQNRIVVLTESEVIHGATGQTRSALILPSPDERAIAELVKTQGRRREGDLKAITSNAVDPTLATDAGLSLLDELLVRTCGLTPTAEPSVIAALQRASFREVVDRWMVKLNRHPLTRMIIVLLAIMRDGTSEEALIELLQRWQRSRLGVGDENLKADAAIWSLRGIDLAVAIPRTLENLDSARIVVRGKDRTVRGPRMSERGVRKDEAPYVDLPSELLRSTLAVKIADEEPPFILARLHRLISEEAIAAHNRLLNFSEWSETFSVHHHRKLIQGLFHGYASLTQGPGHLDEGLRRLTPRSLPTRPSDAYRRLYAVFYRGLLERPPIWEISRVFGREDLKIDLLLLAMNCARDPDAPWRGLYGPDQRLRFPKASATDLGGSSYLSENSLGDLRVLFDQYLGVARAAFHNDRLDDASNAAISAETVLQRIAGSPENFTTRWPEAYMSQGLDLSKLYCDINILDYRGQAEGQLENHLVDEVGQHLERAGFKLSWLGKLVAIPAEASFALMDTTLTDFAEAVETEASRMASRGRASDASVADVPADGGAYDRISLRLAGWSDLLSRYGEAIAQRTLDENFTGGHAAQLRSALIYLYAAERVRRYAFANAPLRRDYYVNGHSTRVVIRVALNLIDLQPNDKSGEANRKFLARQARRHLDMLTRYLSVYPTEKASLLILEAAYARVCGDGTEQPLRTCEAILNRVDAEMYATMHRPRIRMRLLMERNRVHIARLNLMKKSKAHDRGARLLRAAEIDVARLEDLARRSSIAMWTRYAQQRKDALNDYRRELSDALSGAGRRPVAQQKVLRAIRPPT